MCINQQVYVHRISYQINIITIPQINNKNIQISIPQMSSSKSNFSAQSSRSNILTLSQDSQQQQLKSNRINSYYKKFISKLGFLFRIQTQDLDQLYGKISQCVNQSQKFVQANDADICQLIEIAKELKDNHSVLRNMVDVLDYRFIKRSSSYSNPQSAGIVKNMFKNYGNNGNNLLEAQKQQIASPINIQQKFTTPIAKKHRSSSLQKLKQQLQLRQNQQQTPSPSSNQDTDYSKLFSNTLQQAKQQVKRKKQQQQKYLSKKNKQQQIKNEGNKANKGNNVENNGFGQSFNNGNYSVVRSQISSVSEKAGSSGKSKYEQRVRKIFQQMNKIKGDLIQLKKAQTQSNKQQSQNEPSILFDHQHIQNNFSSIPQSSSTYNQNQNQNQSRPSSTPLLTLNSQNINNSIVNNNINSNSNKYVNDESHQMFKQIQPNTYYLTDDRYTSSEITLPTYTYNQGQNNNNNGNSWSNYNYKNQNNNSEDALINVPKLSLKDMYNRAGIDPNQNLHQRQQQKQKIAMGVIRETSRESGGSLTDIKMNQEQFSKQNQKYDINHNNTGSLTANAYMKSSQIEQDMSKTKSITNSTTLGSAENSYHNNNNIAVTNTYNPHQYQPSASYENNNNKNGNIYIETNPQYNNINNNYQHEHEHEHENQSNKSYSVSNVTIIDKLMPNSKINTSILQYQQYQSSNNSSPSLYMYTESNVNAKSNGNTNNINNNNFNVNNKLDSVNTFNSIQAATTTVNSGEIQAQGGSQTQSYSNSNSNNNVKNNKGNIVSNKSNFYHELANRNQKSREKINNYLKVLDQRNNVLKQCVETIGGRLSHKQQEQSVQQDSSSMKPAQSTSSVTMNMKHLSNLVYTDNEQIIPKYIPTQSAYSKPSSLQQRQPQNYQQRQQQKQSDPYIQSHHHVYQNNDNQNLTNKRNRNRNNSRSNDKQNNNNNFSFSDVSQLQNRKGYNLPIMSSYSHKEFQSHQVIMEKGVDYQPYQYQRTEEVYDGDQHGNNGKVLVPMLIQLQQNGNKKHNKNQCNISKQQQSNAHHHHNSHNHKHANRHNHDHDNNNIAQQQTHLSVLSKHSQNSIQDRIDTHTANNNNKNHHKNNDNNINENNKLQVDDDSNKYIIPKVTTNSLFQQTRNVQSKLQLSEDRGHYNNGNYVYQYSQFQSYNHNNNNNNNNNSSSSGQFRMRVPGEQIQKIKNKVSQMFKKIKPIQQQQQQHSILQQQQQQQHQHQQKQQHQHKYDHIIEQSSRRMNNIKKQVQNKQQQLKKNDNNVNDKGGIKKFEFKIMKKQETPNNTTSVPNNTSTIPAPQQLQPYNPNNNNNITSAKTELSNKLLPKPNSSNPNSNPTTTTTSSNINNTTNTNTTNTNKSSFINKINQSRQSGQSSSFYINNNNNNNSNNSNSKEIFSNMYPVQNSILMDSRHNHNHNHNANNNHNNNNINNYVYHSFGDSNRSSNKVQNNSHTKMINSRQSNFSFKNTSGQFGQDSIKSSKTLSNIPLPQPISIPANITNIAQQQSQVSPYHPQSQSQSQSLHNSTTSSQQTKPTISYYPQAQPQPYRHTLASTSTRQMQIIAPSLTVPASRTASVSARSISGDSKSVSRERDNSRDKSREKVVPVFNNNNMRRAPVIMSMQGFAMPPKSPTHKMIPMRADLGAERGFVRKKPEIMVNNSIQYEAQKLMSSPTMLKNPAELKKFSALNSPPSITSKSSLTSAPSSSAAQQKPLIRHNSQAILDHSIVNSYLNRIPSQKQFLQPHKVSIPVPLPFKPHQPSPPAPVQSFIPSKQQPQAKTGIQPVSKIMRQNYINYTNQQQQQQQQQSNAIQISEKLDDNMMKESGDLRSSSRSYGRNSNSKSKSKSKSKNKRGINVMSRSRQQVRERDSTQYLY